MRSRTIFFLYAYAASGMLPSPTRPALAQVQPDTARVAAQARSDQFQARVDEVARVFDNNPDLEKLSHQQRKDLVEFVAGNMLFVTMHEMGHALIAELELPVLGRHEDAADALASLRMLDVRTDFSHRVMVGAALGWYLAHQRQMKWGKKLLFYDEHGLNNQRAYQVVCLMVGSDPDKFTDLADRAEMPKDRQGTCQGDYSNASWSWRTVLKPHLRTSEQPKTKIEVVYGAGNGPYEVYAQLFRSLRLLDLVAERAADEFAWPRPLALEIKSCGKPNAHWDLSTQRLVVCYELAADFAALYRDYGIAAVKNFEQK